MSLFGDIFQLINFGEKNCNDPSNIDLYISICNDDSNVDGWCLWMVV